MAKEDGIYAMRFASQQMLIDKLEQQCKKQQEINQKAIEYIKEKQKIQYKFALSQIECDELLKILEDKEVSE